jgi:Tol biopolymer transport system component
MRSSALVGLAALLAVVLAAPQASATFPGTNGQIAFFIYNGQPSQIAVIEANGTGRLNLTHTTRRENYDPAWSADGAMIAFDTAVKGSPPSVRMMNADGTGQTLVITMSSTYVDIAHPSWSPDGTKIAFCAINQHFKGKIFTVTTDGLATLKKLSPKGSDECLPDWSPDGTTIVFDSFPASGPLEIWTMDADGSNPLKIGLGVTPSWSADGTKIAFTKPAGKRYDVFVMDATGSGVTPITSTARRWEFNPVFSPDGTEIAFSRTIGRHFYDTDDIWTIPVAGGPPTQLTVTPKLDEFGVNWQPIPIP